MAHSDSPRPQRLRREGFAWYRHATQRWVMHLPVDDIDEPYEVMVLEGQRFELVDPGVNPQPGNPFMRIRSCGLCAAVYWEHAHSAAVTLEHLDTVHPGWKDEQ